MSNHEHKPSRVAHVPAILAGSAALIAAVSTLYVNLRGDAQPAPEPAVVEQTAPAAVATPDAAAPVAAPAAPAVPQVMTVRLDRVQVERDGSVGSTDWSFQVNANDKPLFAVAMPALDDTPGENLARPSESEEASAEVELPPGKNVEISVSGWKKKGWLPGARAEVSGKAWLATGINGTVVTLTTDKPKGPQFVLYFSVSPSTAARP